MFIFSLIWKMAKAMVTQGAPESTQAGLLTSSCSSWCLVFLAGTAIVLRAVAGLPTPLWLCTRSMVAMGTGLEGTGMFSASILSSEERGLDLNAGLQKSGSFCPVSQNCPEWTLFLLLCPPSSLQQPTSDQETYSLYPRLTSEPFIRQPPDDRHFIKSSKISFISVIKTLEMMQFMSC